MEYTPNVGRPYLEQSIKSFVDCLVDDAALRTPRTVFLITNDDDEVLQGHPVVFEECFGQA
jgi:hypothetical protein